MLTEFMCYFSSSKVNRRLSFACFNTDYDNDLALKKWLALIWSSVEVAVTIGIWGIVTSKGAV